MPSNNRLRNIIFYLHFIFEIKLLYVCYNITYFQSDRYQLPGYCLKFLYMKSRLYSMDSNPKLGLIDGNNSLI